MCTPTSPFKPILDEVKKLEQQGTDPALREISNIIEPLITSLNQPETIKSATPQQRKTWEESSKLMTLLMQKISNPKKDSEHEIRQMQMK